VWSGDLVSGERGVCELEKHCFPIIFQKEKFAQFFPKIEENLLFVVGFLTYDCVPYNRSLC